MNKVIHVNRTLKCPVEEASTYFSDNDKVKWTTCLDADIDDFVGGKYELFWNLENRDKDSTA